MAPARSRRPDVDRWWRDRRGRRQPQFPTLAERCYQLVYRLCADPRTSDPTLKFLRAPNDFVGQQFLALAPLRTCAHAHTRAFGSILAPTAPDGPLGTGAKRWIWLLWTEALAVDGAEDRKRWPAKVAALTHALAALVQTAALEVHVDAVAGQRLHVRRLLEIAFDRTVGAAPASSTEDERMANGTAAARALLRLTAAVALNAALGTTRRARFRGAIRCCARSVDAGALEQSQSKLLDVLSAVQFDVPVPEPLQLSQVRWATSPAAGRCGCPDPCAVYARPRPCRGHLRLPSCSRVCS